MDEKKLCYFLLLKINPVLRVYPSVLVAGPRLHAAWDRKLNDWKYERKKPVLSVRKRRRTRKTAGRKRKGRSTNGRFEGWPCVYSRSCRGRVCRGGVAECSSATAAGGGCCELAVGGCGKSRLGRRCRVRCPVAERVTSRRVSRVGKCTSNGRLVARRAFLGWSAMFTCWRRCEWCVLGVRSTGIYTPTTKTLPPPTPPAVGQSAALSTLSLVFFLSFSLVLSLSLSISPHLPSLRPPWTWPRTVPEVFSDKPPPPSSTSPRVCFSTARRRAGAWKPKRACLRFI